jgi:hypothetical protein
LDILSYDKFKKFREIYAEQNYSNENYLFPLNNLVETKLRKTFFNQLTLLFGNIKQRLDLYSDIKDKMLKKGINFYVDFNEFENINRGEYKKLILHNKFLKNNYFKRLFANLEPETLTSFLDLFVQTNIDSTHNVSHRIENYNQDKYYYLLMNSLSVFYSINSFYHKLFFKYFYYRVNPDKTISCYFNLVQETLNSEDADLSRNNIKNLDKYSEIKITFDEISKVKENIIKHLKVSKKLILDLEDYDFLTQNYNLEYRKLIAIFALIYNQSSIKTVVNKFNFTLFDGSKIVINLEN